MTLFYIVDSTALEKLILYLESATISHFQICKTDISSVCESYIVPVMYLVVFSIADHLSQLISDTGWV